MATITSSGIGSGLDVESLVARLVAAERQPVQTRLDIREARLQAQLSAVGSIKGALSAFQTAVSRLATTDSLRLPKASVGTSAVLSASATAEAIAGKHSIDVTRLATAHSLASTAFASKTAPIASGDAGVGTLTFRFGTTSYDAGTDTYSGFQLNADRPVKTVAISAANNSLEGIRDAVNAAGIGVQASIVQDASGYRLVFAATDTGAANSLEITASEGPTGDGDDALGLSALSFRAGATHLEQARAAQNAALSVNGLAVSSASNTLVNTLEGVTLNLAATGTTTLEIAPDRGAAGKAVDDFIAAYNQIFDTLRGLSRYDPETRQAAPLTGDALVRGTLGRLRAITAAALGPEAGAYRALADIGIKTNPQTGRLEKDATRLQAVLDADPEAVGRVFAVTGQTTDNLVRYVQAGTAAKAGSYGLEVTRLATQGLMTGTAIGSVTIVAGTNDSLGIAVDGVATGVIALTPGTYSGAALAAELQTRINGDSALQKAGVAVAVTFATDHLVIASQRHGSSSRVTTATGSAAADLGLAAAVSTTGEDVAGTLGGQVALGSGQRLTGTGAAEGIELDILGGALGARGVVNFTRGFATQAKSLVDELLGRSGGIGARTTGIQARIDDIGEQREELSERMAEIERRYREQFTALDGLVSRLQATTNFLNQQLANLPGVGGNQK
ncbi:MAG TPA: flagellar filament capping protein FliD [Porticoccaceae bacterium]|nr:flagellar filament capping protein FliD [Porticoccaceae bacterium]